jgi:hypothetical protein
VLHAKGFYNSYSRKDIVQNRVGFRARLPASAKQFMYFLPEKAEAEQHKGHGQKNQQKQNHDLKRKLNLHLPNKKNLKRLMMKLQS